MEKNSMNALLEAIEMRARANKARVAMGIRDPTPKMLESAWKAQELGYAQVVLVGIKKEIDQIGTELEVVDTEEPEKTLTELMISRKVDAVIRGTARASGALVHLKEALGKKRICRLALLLTVDGTPFFLAPVGIDEGNTISDKLRMIKLGADHIRRFGIEPRVGVLSGGRIGDIGRNKRVDRTLADGEFVTRRAVELGINAKHYTILIEDAIKESNFIVAPDGISGNLIFRTIAFLGGGDGLGAPVLMDDYVFVDTSRVGGHFTKAIMLASALSHLNKERKKVIY
ncbi:MULTISPECIES: methanogenesis marker protein Mmp4/MtxX [Methanosarcina]|uniref:N5-methyltetrahydromethanopterin:coenzyme M methyltransferase subunit X n=3 Tax=Methanosarcina barkeri TaxID=2208 RepID=A0A0E3QX97_METBA|nr:MULTISPECIES: methanogenesis marker protein Mmp4/MtxX [Methanosarcina]AKB55432.1 N5-methyltetrahydromethanopterin:coenzyme M methyltransferase subunit X [Methanosarcina barkeri MS]AKB58915.1 N5-methyltetrahydromethanopterin:coenzyme M methyltransferase subunit X [Methanosarcina barkeri 227]AKJ38595.1 methanogeneis marker protein 4 [Methanosarcina barkeri CM1]OED03957.1 methyltransferase [Methanosarcina sp. A14]